MVPWPVELSQFDITYAPRNIIKMQVFEGFLIELSLPALEDMIEKWIMSVDVSSNLKGSGAGIMLEGSRELILEQSLCSNFQANNNQVEYEVVITGLKLSK